MKIMKWSMLRMRYKLFFSCYKTKHLGVLVFFVLVLVCLFVFWEGGSMKIWQH